MTEIVEVIATALSETSGMTVWKERAGYVLAELEAYGYAWYRPDDCEGVIVESCGYDHEGCRRIDREYVPNFPPGAYSLVPVGGEG